MRQGRVLETSEPHRLWLLRLPEILYNLRHSVVLRLEIFTSLLRLYLYPTIHRVRLFHYQTTENVPLGSSRDPRVKSFLFLILILTTTKMKRTGLSSALAPLVLSLPSFVRSQTVIYPPEGLTVNDGDSMNVVFDTPYSAVNLTVFCLEDTTQDYAFHAYDGNPCTSELLTKFPNMQRSRD